MLDFIDAPDDVLALRVEGRIATSALEQVLDRLDEKMARFDKVNIFVETHAVSGIEFDGLAGYAARAMPLLGQLKRFGRVAIVADQAWIRIGSRIESALLPFVSYRVFEPGDRDAALRWASTGG
jgi:hypothetical protein